MDSSVEGLRGLVVADLLYAVISLVVFYIFDAVPSTTSEIMGMSPFVDAWLVIGGLLIVTTIVSFAGIARGGV